MRLDRPFFVAVMGTDHKCRGGYREVEIGEGDWKNKCITFIIPCTKV